MARSSLCFAILAAVAALSVLVASSIIEPAGLAVPIVFLNTPSIIALAFEPLCLARNSVLSFERRRLRTVSLLKLLAQLCFFLSSFK